VRGITTRADKLYTASSLGPGIHGESMTAGLWDASGILLTHEIFGNRAAQMDPIYTSVSVNHSTHVAGTIIGSDQPQGGMVRGMAYKGNLHAYDWYNDLSEAATAASNGLLISNHSYSMVPQPISAWGTYMSRTASWDQIMFNAPYYLVVWAGGNGGPYTDRLTNEAANKNGIAVASVFQVNNYTGPASVIASDFSSRGPARDGRIKPELCAKGEAVLSSNFNANNTTYNYGWGTSMASASVTGTLLLLQQYYKSRSNPAFMKAATLKGLAIHTADEAGTSPGPDITFGWGLLNAQKAAELISTAGSLSAILEKQLLNGNSYTQTVTAAGNQPLMATLCWTDIPGTAVTNNNDLTPRLINDLDIRITSGGTTYYPWKLNVADLSGPAIQGDNDRDNTEKIEIPNAVAGQTYTITVTHKGNLNILTGMGKQNFSLIISGIASCQSDVFINGLYSTPLTSSGTWIKSEGQTTISPTTVVKLDVASTGYIELKAESGTDFFVAAPTTGEFIAAVLDGCGNGVPGRTMPADAEERPVKYFKPVAAGGGSVIAKSAIAVQPNPSTGVFVVTCLEEVNNTTIRVVDIFGQQQPVKIQDAGCYGKKITMSNAAKGVYLIHIIQKGMTKTVKVILL
jgi:serine protease AprX